MLLWTFSVWVNREDVITYLVGENRVEKEQVKGRRLRLTDVQRRRLATKRERLRAVIYRAVFRRVIRDFVDAAAAPVATVIVVAFAVVMPVADKHAPVGPVLLPEAAEPGVIAVQKVRAVPADIAGAAPRQRIVVDAVAVKVAREKRVPIRGRPVVPQINHGAGVRMAAAGDAVRAFAAA